ncbi:hypothetical protein IC229_13515 [Spirosoma sp. BT702]|uniref:Uncharacterized protein n=1 Tax=Spirosoma profusum TaxID=2771354 RepID=A0A926XVZ1_9BACT|nr:hypothetical protein [Spirosoma profusum]MBD2701663.1 hypothetical protein [Spirosoma profusum]
MKRTLFQVFNVVMAVVVLLSSTGFGLIEHSCQMRGKKKTMVVAFSDVKPPKSCATHKKTIPTDQTTIQRDECCQDNQYYENVDVSSSLSQLAAKCIKAVSEPVATGIVTLLAWVIDWIFAETLVSAAIFSPPLLLCGRDILTLVQCLLI